MRISEIAREVVETHQCKLIRVRKGFKKEYPFQPIEYDCNDYQGKKRGWVILDAVTASAINVCYNALNEENKNKFDSIPLQKLVDFCWSKIK